jgi:hypothetical protein
MDAEGTAAVKLSAGGGTSLKLKAADGTAVLNEIFNAGTAPDTAVFEFSDSGGDGIRVASFEHIGKDFAIRYEGTIYRCLEAIKAQHQQQQQNGKLRCRCCCFCIVFFFNLFFRIRK